MAVDNIMKDLGESYSRLFDHRPVLQGEISFLVNEFEEKRNDREQVRLQRALENSREMSEKLITASVEHLSAQLPLLQSSVNDAITSCDAIINTEGKSDMVSWLEQRRAERSMQWSQFMEAMCGKSTAVDAEFAAEVRRVENYYTDLEDKLHIPQTDVAKVV